MSESGIELPPIPTGVRFAKTLVQTIRSDRFHAATERPDKKPRNYLSGLRCKLTKPIFIVGAPRSGTTFLGSCMHALPEVSYHFEPVATKVACAHVFSGWNRTQAERYFRRVYRLLLLFSGEGTLRLCDKTPQHSFIIPFLSSTFPEAVFIHIFRDGRDAALSLRAKAWLNAEGDTGGSEAGGFRLGPYPRFWVEPERADEFRSTSDLHRCIWAWRRHTSAVLEHGRQLPEHRYLEVPYEQFASNPEPHAQRMLDLMGIENSLSRANFIDAIGQVHTGSVGRWKREMSQDEVRVCEEEAGRVLAELGYECRGVQVK